MKVCGLMSGTSHDGIDAAIVDFDPDGEVLVGTILAASETPYSPDLRRRLVAALPPAPSTLAEITALDTLIGQEFADAAAALAETVGGVDYACTHGQTVYHWVESNRTRGTLQIGNPAWLAEALRCPVVSDVRMADVAAGGSGAPLVPILDLLLAGSVSEPIGMLNLGGIANVTVVGQGSPVAYDIGPANALIDAAVSARGLTATGYDEGGRIAARGTVHRPLLDELLAEEYYALPAPKSTGKELFHLGYIRERVERVAPGIADEDLIATLTELTVATVVADLAGRGLARLAVSGGGSHNPIIMAGLRRGLPGVAVETTEGMGVPADAKEAIAFALIGWLTAHGLPGNVPSITGAAGPRVLGRITPGPRGFAEAERPASPSSSPTLPPAATPTTFPTALVLRDERG